LFYHKITFRLFHYFNFLIQSLADLGGSPKPAKYLNTNLFVCFRFSLWNNYHVWIHK